VELGKKLANDVKGHLEDARKSDDHVIEASNPASSRILNYYVSHSRDNACGSDSGSSSNDVNPLTRVTRKTHTDHKSALGPPTQHDLGGNAGKLS
jgi:glucose-6-phosphate isomerase